jgi:predicted ATP-dependent endonuclease of OLD family
MAENGRETDATIIGLEVENVKRIKVFSLRPTETGLVVIGGDNEAGKSSVLDSIAAAIGGGNCVPGEAVRRGEEKGRVEVVLSGVDLKVERRFNATGTTSLTVTSADGSRRLNSPQAVLDKLVGALSFDPLAFASMTPINQRETLRKLVGLDLSDLDAEEGDLYAQRTEVNRDAKRLAAEADGVCVHESFSVPAVPVDVTALVAELRDANENNALRNTRVASALAAERDLTDAERTLETAKYALCQAEALVAARREAAVSAKQAMQTGPQHVETQPIEAKIAGAQNINAEVQARARKTELRAKAAAKRTESDNMTARLSKIAAERTARVAAANMPIAGLSLSPEGVRFDGTLFSECSSAQRLRVSVAMAIAMNPRLRVMLIRDGSLLDSGNMKMIADMAKQNGVQVWVERVGAGPEVSVVLEAGEIKEIRNG